MSVESPPLYCTLTVITMLINTCSVLPLQSLEITEETTVTQRVNHIIRPIISTVNAACGHKEVPRSNGFHPSSNRCYSNQQGIQIATKSYQVQPPKNIGKLICVRTMSLGTNCSVYQIWPGCWEWVGWRRTGRSDLSREIKFSGANADRGKFILISCSADHEQDWKPYLADPYSCYRWWPYIALQYIPFKALPAFHNLNYKLYREDCLLVSCLFLPEWSKVSQKVFWAIGGSKEDNWAMEHFTRNSTDQSLSDSSNLFTPCI